MLITVELEAEGSTGVFFVEAEGLTISLKGGEGGATTIGSSSLGITTGGIGTTFGIGAHVRGTVAGLVSGVVAVAVVVLTEGVALIGVEAVAGRLLG